MPDLRYVVMNENTLGYIHPETPAQMSILHGSCIKGGHSWLKGFVYISRSDVLRDATVQDFHDYRVSPRGHIDCPEIRQGLLEGRLACDSCRSHFRR